MSLFNQPVSPEFEPYYPYFIYPPWVYGFISENGVRCFREFRVFIDSLIILFFMKGYREDLFDAVLWIFISIKKLWINFRYKMKKTSFEPIHINLISGHGPLFNATVQT
uniref:Maturase K n=1 Tax=Panagrolaimus davidi TaxID=227884 RepID=A0A914PQU7_9BILA